MSWWFIPGLIFQLVADKNISAMNHERWLVSYADFITLMFAFFVVMFASSQVDKKRMAIMAASFDSFINTGTQITRGPKEAHPTTTIAKNNDPRSMAKALTMAEMKPTLDRLQSQLFQEIELGKIEINLRPRGLVLSLKEAAFFAPGQDAVSPEALPILAKVTEALREVSGQIRLEGHTDDTPIHSPKFPSNWQLSTARSIAVLKLLAAEFHFPADRMAAAGYGEYQPLEPNNSEKGKSKNRRVDLVILSEEAAAMAPE